jgi:hypothetical protein
MNTGLILIILLLCCCIILLIGGFGFFLFKTSEEEEGTPTITLDDVTVEAEVEEESTTENYTYDELSKNIKLNIKWSNGSDFDDVTNVYFTRTHGDKTEKKETDANGRKSNTTGNKIQFVQKPGEDMRGEHTIKVTYKLKGQTQEKVMTTFQTNISDDQLTLAADSVSPVSVSYSPATVPFSTEVETQKTAATLNPNPSGFGALFFIPSGTNNAIKIKRVSDGKFLTHSATWGATGGVFYVQSSTGDKRRISTTATDDGKLLTSVGPALKNYTDMNPEERQKSLFTISFAAYTGPLSCSSPGSPSLAGKYWIVSADGQRSKNRMIFLGDSGTDGRAQLAEWDYWADSATKWDIKEVPGEAGTYWIVSDANQRSANRMIFLGDSGTDGRARLAEWDYWADPATKWKLLADPKAPGEYWIVSDANQRSPCRMIFLGDSGTDGRAQLAEWDFWEDPATKWKLIPTGPGPTSPGRVKGWSRVTTGLKNVENIPTPEGCLAEAKKVGSPYWIHRNSTHPTMANSCDIKAWTDVYAGDDSDTAHLSGCTYGGNPQTGCTPWPSVQGYPAAGAVGVTPSGEFQTLNPNDCVTKAKEIGALSWGYRTANHPEAPYKNTCFFLSNFDAGFTGNAEDTAHISGCTNGKSLSNKCV